MASYKDKVNQRKMATESGKIAFSIELIEHLRYGIRKEWQSALRNGDGVPIFDNITVYYDGKIGVYYTIIKDVPYKPNRFYYKVVHRFSNYDEMVRMLDSQEWNYM